MKKIVFTLLLLLATSIVFTQNQQVVDSLKHELAIATQDTSRALILVNLCELYRFSKPDSAMQYIEPAVALAQQIKFYRGEAVALGSMSGVLREAGNFPQALEIAFKSIQIADNYGCLPEKAYSLLEIGTSYRWSNEYVTAINYLQQAKKIFEELPLNNKRTNRRLLITYVVLAATFNDLNQMDSVLYYQQKAYDKYNQLQQNKNIEARERFLALLLQVRGEVETHKGNYPLALDYYQQGIEVADKVNEYRDKSFIYVQIAKLYKQTNQLDSCIYYAKKGLMEGQKGPFRKAIIDNSALLADAYQLKKDYKQAFQYQEIILAANVNLYGIGNIHTVQKMIADEEETRQRVEADNIAYRNRIKQYALLGGLGIMGVIGFILYGNNYQKQKANLVLQEQKDKVETTLKELKSTQNQLIQKEKLASLGELTAGIAHEIQNPLNFVNNFSELSVGIPKI